MNELQINNFMAVAEEKSFSRAAERLFASQPNLSRSISKLEDELGVVLFDRSGKKVQLTEAGREYYDFFRRTQMAFRQVSVTARKLHCNRLGNIRMGYMEGWKVSKFADDVLGKLRQHYPNMDIQMEAYNRSELLEQLDRDEIDIVLGIKGILGRRRGLRKKDVAEIVRGILCRRKDWEDRQVLMPGDFRDETFFVMDEDGDMVLGSQIREFCEPYGFIPRIQYVNSFDTMLNYVEMGRGVLVCDEWTRCTESAELLFVPLNSVHTVTLGWKEESQNVALSVLIEEIEKSI